MCGPCVVEALSDAAAEAWRVAGHGHESHATAAIAFLKQLAQLVGEDVALDKAVAQHGDAYGSAQGVEALEGLIERGHAAVLVIGHVVDAGHAGAARVHADASHLEGIVLLLNLGQHFQHFFIDERVGTQVAQ